MINRIKKMSVGSMAVVLVLLVAAIAFGAITTKNYMTNKGDKWVVGGDLEVTSGGRIIVDSGATVQLGATSTTLPGQWRLVSLGALTNAAAAGKTLLLVDETPAGEFTATDADVACTTETSVIKSGTGALKMAVTTTADATDGCADGVTYDFSADESVGFWIRSTVALDSGDLYLNLLDDGGARTIDIPAVAANTWTYVNLTTGITALSDAEKNTITSLGFLLSSAGATKAASGAFSVYIDEAYKWDSTEQHTLGVLSEGSAITATSIAATTAVTAQLTELTDYFISWSGTTASLVGITDQSNKNGLAVVNY